MLVPPRLFCFTRDGRLPWFDRTTRMSPPTILIDDPATPLDAPWLQGQTRATGATPVGPSIHHPSEILTRNPVETRPRIAFPSLTSPSL